ncbi:MAG: type I DNA topoisomerase [Planctomyces sp.]|nr:type I DNA topoisomerase [Planctomyces sp.]MBA4120289.1 type I DNA topoisomerase [Isosphaera sp.]
MPGLSGRQLVIVESPAKAKTINKYLGSDYTVMASVGHVRDLPTKNPKGVKAPVPGVDLEDDFRPTYVILDKKGKVITELKRMARLVGPEGVWFATDPDREGEAIAWHLAEELGIDPRRARRVMFNAITKAEVQRAFRTPRTINMDRVNAQQARRILDRIVGYQVSPLLWKKVARGLSAGRVQSVAVRLIVERERAIRAFVPDEAWEIGGVFAAEAAKAAAITAEYTQKLGQRDAKGNPPTAKAMDQLVWSLGGFGASLAEVGGERFELGQPGAGGEHLDLSERARRVAELAGLIDVRVTQRADESAKGPARVRRSVSGTVDPSVRYRVSSVTVKRVAARPSAPFITSTLQQAGSNRLGYTAKRTMAAAQQLYQGVEIPGEGPVALITYMRTDSVRLSPEALAMARQYIPERYGERYLPEKPNVYASSNKDAQEAHEAIRPTSTAYPPEKVRSALKPELLRVYQLIWDRFIASQMAPAQWDSTTLNLTGGRDPATPVTFRATGRTLVFDGFYKAAGVPASAEEQDLPTLAQGQAVAPAIIEPRQTFTSPPARYTEASLIKTLESEGIGRPSTYASIITVIQDRKYAELVQRRFYATSLGEAVTDKLLEAFPDLMDVGYTREMEADLDRVEDEHLDWVEMLRRFYGPFRSRLAQVEHTLTHAKAEVTPAPDAYRCAKCASPTVYRLGKNGRFLSCSTYPACDYACPVDRDGVPQPIEQTDVACPKCASAMTRRTGRFGAFLGCSRYNDKQSPCDGILNFDKLGRVVAKAPGPFMPAPPLPCPKCGSACYLRPGKYGPWLGCSRFPKCRGRGDWKALPEKDKAALLLGLEAHQKANPIPIIRTAAGTPLTGPDGKPLPGAPRLDGKEDESLETVADELGV